MRVGAYYGNWQPVTWVPRADFESRTKITVRGGRKLLNSAAHDSRSRHRRRQGAVGFGTFYVRNLSVVIMAQRIRREINSTRDRVVREIA